MRKFICISELTIIGKKLANIDQVVTEGDTLQSDDESISLKMELDDLINNPIFEEIKPNVEIEIKEVLENEEEITKDWILQIKVNTTRKKLREIEFFIQNNLEKLL